VLPCGYGAGMRWLTFAALAWLALFALALPLAAGGNQTISGPGLCPEQETCNSPEVIDVHWRAAFLFAGVVATVLASIVVAYTALVLRYRPDSYLKWLAAGAWVLLFVAGYINAALLLSVGPLTRLIHAMPFPLAKQNIWLAASVFGVSLATVVTLAGLIIARRRQAHSTRSAQQA
jgi:hypothetical protein